MDKIVEIIFQDWVMDLEFILNRLEITDEEVLQALLDQGVVTQEELQELVNEEDNEETFN
jgi:predicted transcriptional regulator